MDKINDPVKRPIKPLEINPPIAPRKITIMGTAAPLPSTKGFRMLSVKVAMINQMVIKVAVKESVV